MSRMLAALLVAVSLAVAPLGPVRAAPDPAPGPGMGEWVRFTSLDGPPATILDGYMFRPLTRGPHPAVVFLHGCGGLIAHEAISPRERDWAFALNAAGYIVLMIDSFTPRGVQGMCELGQYQPAVFAARPYDAYAALLYLQMQPDVLPGRIGLIGWSEGGGVVLDTIRARAAARPANLPAGDFAAAVAFYPAGCSTRAQGKNWASPIPLMVLIGADDVWTPAQPCQDLLRTSPASRSHAEIVIYPATYHDFDWPGMPMLRRPEFTTAGGVVPIQGTNPAALSDAFRRVPAFLSRWLLQQ